MKTWIMDNWQIILTVLFSIGLAVFIALYAPKNWLLWAVMQAEKELGSGTGQLKLLMVYNLFVERFPVISKFIPFKLFSYLVDKALDKMREILQKSKPIASVIEGSGQNG